MSEKKGKSLAMKLLDELISDDESKAAEGQKKIENQPTAFGGTAAPPISDDLDGHPSRTIEVSEVVQSPVSKAKAPDVNEDATIRLSESRIVQADQGRVGEKPGTPEAGKLSDRFAAPKNQTEPRAAIGRVSPLRSAGFNSATEAALASSENLRIAQNRILDLEREIERLRLDNEQLAAAGETLRRRADELATQSGNLERRLSRTAETKEQEVDLLRQAQGGKEKELSSLRLKLEEFEMRLSTNIQKIRVRERELENRLELVKMESSALVRNKDEIILDLKRQVDQLNRELENYRNKGQELNKQLSEKQETLRRTVKALRIALSMLEGDAEADYGTAQKKVK